MTPNSRDTSPLIINTFESERAICLLDTCQAELDLFSWQGTHVCSIPGVYVLQWKYKSGAPTGQAHSRHTRAKVMYYHEVLPSGDFK